MNNIVFPKNVKDEMNKLMIIFKNAYDKIMDLAIMQSEYKNDETSPLFVFFNNQEGNLLQVAKCMRDMKHFMIIMEELSKDEKILIDWNLMNDDEKSLYFEEMAKRKMEESKW